MIVWSNNDICMNQIQLIVVVFCTIVVIRIVVILPLVGLPLDGEDTGMSKGQNDSRKLWTHHNLSDFSQRSDTDRRIDNLNVSLPEYLVSYRSPCWYEDASPPFYNLKRGIYWRWDFKSQTIPAFSKMAAILESRLVHDGKAWRLRCLPLVYQIGVMKCGTSDLFYSMTSHPDIVRPAAKEPNYWNMVRYGHNTSFGEYLDLFDYSSERIRRREDKHGYHSAITVDASVHYLFLMPKWRRLPGNSAVDVSTGPKVITADLIKQFVPQAKIVVILRNPIDRLYSEYNYFNRGRQTSPSEFHDLVRVGVQDIQNCLRHRNVRSCLYDNDVIKARKSIKLVAGLYEPFLRDWMTSFPLSAFHVVLLEEYRQNKADVMRGLFRFLELDPDKKVFVSRKRGFIRNRVSGSRQPAILNQTRTLLQDFYGPWNRRLCDLLSDNKYLFW